MPRNDCAAIPTEIINIHTEVLTARHDKGKWKDLRHATAMVTAYHGNAYGNTHGKARGQPRAALPTASPAASPTVRQNTRGNNRGNAHDKAQWE